jgi:predicted GNAT family acetyltransferase
MTYVWEDKGVPVAMASLGRPTKNGISVKTVYTPPEYRKQGYGTALVAAVSAEGLRRGKKFCVLYAENTNLANSIYQQAGYEFVTESSQYVFCPTTKRPEIKNPSSKKML